MTAVVEQTLASIVPLGRNGTDGVTNTTRTFTAASANFTRGGRRQEARDRRPRHLPARRHATYTIAAFVDSTHVTLDTATPDTATGLTWHLDPLHDATYTLSVDGDRADRRDRGRQRRDAARLGRNTVRASYQADAPPETIYDGVDFPSGAEIHVGVGNATHAVDRGRRARHRRRRAISAPTRTASRSRRSTTRPSASRSTTPPHPTSIAALGTSLLEPDLPRSTG